MKKRDTYYSVLVAYLQVYCFVNSFTISSKHGDILRYVAITMPLQDLLPSVLICGRIQARRCNDA